MRPEIPEPTAKYIAAAAVLIAVTLFPRQLVGQFLKPAVGPGHLQAIKMAAIQVIFNEALLDGGLALGGKIVVHPYIDLFPAKNLDGPVPLMATNDGAIGHTSSGSLRPLRSMSSARSLSWASGKSGKFAA